MKEAKVLLKIIKAFIEEREIVLDETIDEEKLYWLSFYDKIDCMNK